MENVKSQRIGILTILRIREIVDSFFSAFKRVVSSSRIFGWIVPECLCSIYDLKTHLSLCLPVAIAQSDFLADIR